MRQMKLPLAAVLVLGILLPVSARAQGRVAFVDLDRAMVQTVEGKKAEAAFNAKLEELQKEAETRQAGLQEAQAKVQDATLDATARAALTRDIENRQTELNRFNEDAQKTLDGLRGQLMEPLATTAGQILELFAAEAGFGMLIDVSNPANTSILYVAPDADVTDELIRRIDAEYAKRSGGGGWR